MIKTGNGIVDNAEKVNNHTVESDVPANAKFTDTVYDDTELRTSINNKVGKVEGKGLSTNDFTTAYKNKLDNITTTKTNNWDTAYTHSQSTHAPTNAQANVIESVKVNGTAVSVTNKSVDITVPTNNNQLTNGAGYQTSAQVQSAIETALEDLPLGVESVNGQTGAITLNANDVGAIANATGTYVQVSYKWVGTQAQYDTLTDINDYTEYNIIEE